MNSKASIWLVLFLLPLTVLGAYDLNGYRDMFCQTKGEKDFQKIIDAPIEDSNPGNVSIINAYKSVATSAMAQYSMNPFRKYGLFLDGKEGLEKSISEKKAVDNIFLRLVMQLSVPKFLGYYENIEEDIAFLESELPKSTISISYRNFLVKSLSEIEQDEYDLSGIEKILLVSKK